MQDIKGYATFTSINPINKGWSSDKKYCVETINDEKLLLRVTDSSEYDKKKREFEIMEQLASHGIPMSRPIDFGICDNGKSVYTLFTWCEGEDAANILPKLPETKQYELGLQSGKILRSIHNIPAPAEQEDWAVHFNRKIDNKIKGYYECGVKIDGEESFISYIANNRHLLNERPQCFQHGDYHVGNMVISKEGELSIIDFNRSDYGDPWEEFNRIVWSATASPYFATGQLNGYFNGRPPELFFKLLAYYISVNALSSVYWSIPFGDEQIEIMKKQVSDVLAWFDNMNHAVPTWYLANFYIQYVDDVPYKLKSPFDFSFIKRYGEVFTVFDDQDSGNICFGVQKEGKKYFVKFAGAPTEQFTGRTEDAIARLKKTVPIYTDLAHPNLIKLINAEEIGGGFATIFEWIDGECMGKMYPLSREKFLQMNMDTRLQVFQSILDFHIHVAKQGYVAIDFYEGSMMYDFHAGQTYICDIDYYAKMPYINLMGRMWGSSRFMSPEEFTYGEAIDEITMVYVMGATAFALFGGEDGNKAVESWELKQPLFNVALKAVNASRDKRQQTLTTFKHEWNAQFIRPC